MSIDIQDYYDKIYKYCYFKVNDKEIAEDLTQQSFLKYLSQNNYIDQGKPLAYLYTIARNQCYDYYKKIKIEPLSEDIKVDNNDEDILTKLAIEDAVKKLDSELNEIILLHFGSGFNVLEIAKLLGISRFSVHRKINNALKDLKKELSKEDFYE